MHDEVFTIPARRCKRCGGLLASSRGLRDGYGPCCLRKIKQEEADMNGMEDYDSLVEAAGNESEAERLARNYAAMKFLKDNAVYK